MIIPTALRRPGPAQRLKIAAASGFGLIELRAASPLAIQVQPGGGVFALRHGPTLLNQLLPGPAEEGLFRLLIRWREQEGTAAGWAPLAGPGLAFEQLGPAAVCWRCAPRPGLRCETELRLQAEKAMWRWHVRVWNETGQPLVADVVHAQDLGLADEAAVRNNEAYASQYIDFQPVHAPDLGCVLFARQNLAMRGRHPWLACAWAGGAAAYCTDGYQFFGDDYRLTNVPAAVRAESLPSRRLQYEFALAGLQSQALTLKPGKDGAVTLIAQFVEDHPAASGSADLALVREALAANWDEAPPRERSAGTTKTARSIFLDAPWCHGDAPTDADWAAWFPGERRQEEHGPDGSVHAFFHGEATHVVSRAKEATVARPHGHILRSGEARWFDAGHFGLTCYAAGIFAAQAYLGHPSFARLLSVVRNPLNVVRGAGQRAFIRRGGGWQQFGVPSAFVLTPGGVRWIYRFGGDVIEVSVGCAHEAPVAFLELHVIAGPACEFLFTHELALDAGEYEHGGEIEVHAESGWIGCFPSPDSLVGRHEPQVCFAIAAADPAQFAAVGGDELLYDDGKARSGPYVVLQSRPTRQCGDIQLGARGGAVVLPAAVAAARANAVSRTPLAAPPAAPVRLRGGHDAGVARVDEILPWFTHNAAIHFSAPHGLEQYGGAAWGVRDVCQGSVEWLLAAGEFGVVRWILETVFAQQYATDGDWPQWFMFPPYRFIQQPHSHGDVCFWPVKALCDYLEASNDLAFLQTRQGYMDAKRFEPVGPEETILAHCDRVIDQCEARFIAGTALVNYGDGDWDDTLQPADPTLRTHMTSAWTVGLAFHTFRQLAEVCRRGGETARAARLEQLLARMRNDFSAQLMPGGVVAGFMVVEADGTLRPLLHPSDTVTGIRYRLLPMTRSILAELFTPAEAVRHLQIIEQALKYPDGVRLMSEPTPYHGGVARLFQRAETAANVGREIGLQYVHAHLRYAEALAKVGEADALWAALQAVNPVGLAAVVASAVPRQSNVYFSSSDADFADRYEAAEHWGELRGGKVPVRGGWRLYSSGPGLFLHKIRACLLGVRERFDEIVFDPVLPFRLDGLVAETTLAGRPVALHYRVRTREFAPESVVVNGVACETLRREFNPYRSGGVRLDRAELEARLKVAGNVIEIGM